MSEPRRTIHFTLNGRPVTAHIAVYETVTEVLQREFHLFGGRESCGQGICGCCTVLVNGTAVSGCLYLAAFADGAELRTVEGLAENSTLDPIQQAFVDKTAFQCGYCTPGFILMTEQLLKRYPQPTDDQIRHFLSGNLCRCGAYPDIIAAVKEAAAKLRS